MKEFTKEYNFSLKEPELIVIGCSAGGIDALKSILSSLSENFRPAVVIVQHISVDAPQALAEFFQFISHIKIKEAEDKETILPNKVYFAPSGYHLLISNSKTFQLSVEEPVNYSRPSIDILFETAADAYHEDVLGIILTGANDDGAKGLLKIKNLGGRTLIQQPSDAEFSAMPEGALKKVPDPDALLPLSAILQLMHKFGEPR